MFFSKTKGLFVIQEKVDSFCSVRKFWSQLITAPLNLGDRVNACPSIQSSLTFQSSFQCYKVILGGNLENLDLRNYENSKSRPF